MLGLNVYLKLKKEWRREKHIENKKNKEKHTERMKNKVDEER